MTDALKAMVEAMAAEIVQQECRLVLQPDGVTLDSGYDGAQFDLEKVARAGLLGLDAYHWGDLEPDEDRADYPKKAWFVDMILMETP